MATLSNSGEQLFAVGTAGDDATWLSLWDASTGGTYYGKIEITGDPDALETGERFRILDGDLDLIFTAGSNIQDALVKAVLDVVVANGLTVFVQVHSDDPGTDGTANAISGTARIQISGWSAAGA